MKRYYIVEWPKMWKGKTYWSAHAGLWARLGWFSSLWNEVTGTMTFEDADDCERLLRSAVAAKSVKPQVVRIVQL